MSQVIISSETESGIGITIIAEYDYQPAEDAEYEGGTPVYPGCEESVEITDYYAEDEITGEIVEHELTDAERDALEVKAKEEHDER